MNTALFPVKTWFDSNNYHFKREDCTELSVAHLEHLVRPRLKIAIVTETWSPEVNGVALSLLNICKGLQKQGHKILLIRPMQNRTCAEFKPNRECLVMGQVIPKYTQMQFGWPQYRKVSKALDAFMPDVVHVATEGPLGLAVLQVAKMHHIPVTSAFHSAFQDFSRFYDLAFLVKPIQHYLKWFHNNTQVTCVPSQDTANAIQNFGVQGDIRVIKTGVDVQQFSPRYRSHMLRRKWGASENTTVLIYVGRVSQEKEIEVLIHAYEKLKHLHSRHFKLVIVGDGPDKSRLQQLSQGLDVYFTGVLRGQALAEAFASADVFLLSSQVETFGNVVLEAMASGLAIMAYNYACAKQYVTDECGWLFPLGQPERFFEQLIRLPSNQVLRLMGTRSVRQVQHAGWNHPVQQLENLFYQVAHDATPVSL